MHVISRSEIPVVDAIQAGAHSPSGTPLTYELLRHILVDSGSMDEREARKMDRAMHRLLDR